MKRWLAAALAALAIGAGAMVVLTRHGDHPPFFPQYRRQVHDPLYAAVGQATKLDPRGRDLLVAPPTMPKVQPPSGAAYRSALLAGKDRPGALAFHADTDLYCEYNRAQVEEQARKEGLTIDQVKELTFFGFVGLRTTQAGKVEEVLGRPLTSAEHGKLDSILAEENASFAKTMHEAVDRGASEDERWATILAAEEHYRLQFEQAFNLDAAGFDRMLVPDPDDTGGGLPHAPPSDIPLPGPEPSPEPSGPPPVPGGEKPKGPGLTPVKP